MGYPTQSIRRLKRQLEIFENAIGVTPDQRGEIARKIVLLRIELGQLQNPIDGEYNNA